VIKAVAFDYGGVISLPMEEKDMEELASLAGINTALMSRIYWDNRPIYDQGLVSAEEYFRNILADVGIFPDLQLIGMLIDRDVESWSRINPAVETLMRDLKTAGFKIGILSNMVKVFLDRNKKTLPVFGIPDVMIFSCEVDAVKPEEKIYRMLLDQLECQAQELVFFDDTEINVKAACRLGIDALIWEGADIARERLNIPGPGGGLRT
jgi:putative hydrolase of the HAD superfamily